MGYSQVFVPLRPASRGDSRVAERESAVATREYFPRSFKPSISQRCRWVTGIALQGWERHGWRGPWRQLYWFWRDRKGLVGNLLTPVANLLLLYGLARYEYVGDAMPAWLSMGCETTFAIAILQIGIRTQSAARIYGWAFASGVPFRMAWGNLVNCAATATALAEYWTARLRGRGVPWRKTDHIYPVTPPWPAEPDPALRSTAVR